MYQNRVLLLFLIVTITIVFALSDTNDSCNHANCNQKRKVGAISQQKCKEVYSDRITEGYRIVEGGVDAKAREYPHMVALGYGEWDGVVRACGGSLISEKFVLTAAHCIDTVIGPVRYIRLGALNLTEFYFGSEDADPHDYNISRFIIHPEYKPPLVYNDIALIELDGIVEYGEFIAPACLQTEQNITVSSWSALGWGETSPHGSTSDHLQVMKVLSKIREVEYTLCKNSYINAGKRRLRSGVDNESQICAGEGKIDTCQGDSGGPLQIKNAEYETGYTIIGVTSFGKPCTSKPAVYTRVSHYIEWIESIVWPE